MSVPAATIVGIGAVTPLGRDLDVIATQLETATRDVAEAKHIDEQLLADPAINSQMRRADRFTWMAVLAATDAWKMAKSACAAVAPERIGMILSSGFGPHCRGFKFLDGILDNGESAASPTDFSHSVHGAASAYISRMLGIRGPGMAITDFEIGFEEMIQLAQCWLHQGACDRVLLGAVEELGEVMLYCSKHMTADSRPLSPGEGAVFLMLAPASVNGIAKIETTTLGAQVDLLLVEDPPVLPHTADILINVAATTATFVSHFGHCASSTAFEILGGLLAIGRQRPLGKIIHQNTSTDAIPKSIDTAATFRTSSPTGAVTVLLTRDKH